MRRNINGLLEEVQLHSKKRISLLLNSQVVFESSFKKDILQFMSEVEYTTVLNITEDYLKAVISCRKGNLDVALEELKKTDLELDQLSPSLFKVAHLFKLSAWANYHYKDSEYDRAIDLLVTGFKESASLEVNEGITTLIHRRIEQLLNISYVLRAGQQNQKANSLLFDTLHFSLMGKKDGLFINEWNYEYYISKPILSDNNSIVLLKEICYIESKAMTNKDVSLMNFFEKKYAEVLKNISGSDDYIASIVFNWIFIKQELNKKVDQKVINLLASFLHDKDIDSALDFLKVNLLIQACSMNDTYSLNLIANSFNIDEKTRKLLKTPVVSSENISYIGVYM